MKPSRYNHFFNYDDAKSIAYNASSNSLALINNPNLEAYQNFCEHGTAMPEDLIAELKKGTFLLDDFVDELDLLRYQMLRTRYRTDSLSITIAPTNDCQFACVYCYERDAISSKYMTPEVQDKLVEMLESRKELISSFNCIWYGGEPLMAFDIVESLSKRFIEICQQNNIKYSASMITNGYLLTRDIINRMSDLHISTVQITIDGLPEVHNRMRPLIGGGKTFETIFSNLKDGYDLLPFVAIRVNIDKDNVRAGDDIYKFLQDNNMQEKVKPYFGKIMSDAGTYSSSKCLNMCDFSEINYDFASRTVDESSQSPTQYPTLKSVVCGADSTSCYVIDAEGWIYKCWCDIGLENGRVGSIVQNFNAFNDLLFQYMLFDPTANEPCKDCNVLPLCMGGCPYRRVAGSVDNCTNHKFILQKCLENAVSFFQNQRIIKNCDAVAE